MNVNEYKYAMMAGRIVRFRGVEYTPIGYCVRAKEEKDGKRKMVQQCELLDKNQNTVMVVKIEEVEGTE